MNSKWIIDLNVKFKTIKHLEETEENLYDIGLAKDFLHRTQKVRILKEMFDDLHFLKLTISVYLMTANGRKIEKGEKSQIKLKYCSNTYQRKYWAPQYREKSQDSIITNDI